MLSDTLRLKFFYLKIIHIVHPGYYSKMKMKIKIKNRFRRYDINRSKSRHGHKNSKCKTFHSMVMLICITQHLSNIWSSIHERFKQNWSLLNSTKCYQMTQ